MKYSKEDMESCCTEPGNRGVTGQSLYDTGNPEADAQSGTPTTGNEVNLDPRSRDDEGS